MIVLSYGITFSQPIIPLGNSRNFVKFHMAKDTIWKLSHESRLELVYTCDTSSINVTYRFKKDSPAGIYCTCTETSIHFPSESRLTSYLDEKLNNCRLRPDGSGLSYTLVTDLYDSTIHVYTIGSRTLLIKY